MATTNVTIYTDPGCPFGFNAGRQELQLMWHYPDAEIDRRMIVLTERSSTFEERGMTPQMAAAHASASPRST